MFQYSFKMSKVFFQHLLLLFSLKSWHLHCTQFLIHTTYTLCLYLWRSAKATDTILKIYTSICMLFDDIYDMQSNSSTNEPFMNFNFTWAQWTTGMPGVRTQDTLCVSSRQHLPALEITVWHPYLMPAWEQSEIVLHFSGQGNAVSSQMWDFLLTERIFFSNSLLVPYLITAEAT